MNNLNSSFVPLVALVAEAVFLVACFICLVMSWLSCMFSSLCCLDKLRIYVTSFLRVFRCFYIDYNVSEVMRL